MNARRAPIAVITLIGVDIAMAYVTTLRPDLILTLGFVPAAPTLVGALASWFVHANLLHLAGNMIFLAAVGPSVEHSAGTWRFLAVFAAGGLTGVLAEKLLAPTSTTPMVGASGCIAACIAYFAVRHYRVRATLGPGVRVPVAAIVAIWVALQVLGGVFQVGDAPTGGTSYWAHLGGFLAGLLLSVIFGAPKMVRAEADRDAEAGTWSQGAGATVRQANQATQQEPSDREALWAKARAERELGDRDGEVEALVVLARGCPTDEVGEVYPRLAELNALTAVASVDLLKAADVPGLAVSVAHQLRSLVAFERESDPLRPEALLALAAGEGADAERARHAIANEFPLHPVAEVARRRGWLP